MADLKTGDRVRLNADGIKAFGGRQMTGEIVAADNMDPTAIRVRQDGRSRSAQITRTYSLRYLEAIP